jgi:hypothetical protein
MAKAVRVWYDQEGDFLEVLFSDEPGFMKETANDAVMERVSLKGEVIGFSVLGVSQSGKDKPIYAELVA